MTEPSGTSTWHHAHLHFSLHILFPYQISCHTIQELIHHAELHGSHQKMTDSLDAEIAFVIQANKVGRHAFRIKVLSPPECTTDLESSHKMRHQHRLKTKWKWGAGGYGGPGARKANRLGYLGSVSIGRTCSPDAQSHSHHLH